MNENKINIVITGVSLFSLSVSAVRVKNLINPLRHRVNLEIQNLVITSPQMENQFEHEQWDKKIEYLEIKYDLRNIFSLLTFVYGCFISLRRMKRKGSANILYIYGYPDLTNIFSVLFAIFLKYRIIYDIVEDNSVISDYKSFKGRVKNYSSLFLIRNISRLGHGAIAISSHLKAQLERYSKNKIPIELIPISVDCNSFPAQDIKSNGSLKMFYGGSFGEKDSIEVLLDAFGTVSKSYDNLRLVLTGTGAERHLTKLHHLIENNPGKDKIDFKGFLAVNEYFKTINECDILCVTRSSSAFANAGFPFKLGEFLASGKPVIVSKVSDVQNYIKNNQNGLLVNPDSKDDLINAITTLINDKVLRKKIGEEGRKTAKQFFDSGLVSDKFYTFINTVIQAAG